MMAALTLAAVLAFPSGAETVRISEELWPERRTVEKIEHGERVWWWSKQCTPQLLTAQEATVVCTATRQLHVTVADRAAGKPIPGARVIWGMDAMLAHVPDALLPSATTDAEGTAVLHVPASAVRIRVDGPRTASWWESATATTSALRLATVPAAPLSLEVTPGSRTVVELEVPVSEVRSWAVARDGHVRLPVIPPVPVTLAAWSEASAPVVMEVDAARMPRTLELPRGTTIAGRVVDARRRPVEGAAIEAVFGIGKLLRGLRRTMRTGSSGAFVVRGIPPGPMRLQVSKPELVTIVRAVQPDADTDLGNITLRSARRASVRVVDRDGQPVAGATVRIADGPSASTDRAGLARLEGVPAEEDVAVHVTARGFRPADADLPADTKSPLAIELSRGVRVLGSVTTEHGSSAGAGDVLVINNGTQRVVAFDDSGAIDIGGLEEGTLSLEVRAPSLTPLSIPKRHVAADETWDLGILQLAAGHAIAGRVFDEDGLPLPGARLRALRPHARGPEVAAVMNDWVSATSDDGGAFRVSGLGPGSHLLLADAAGFAPRMLTIEPNDEPLDVRLDRARGLVIDCAPVARCGSEARLLYGGALHPWAMTEAAIQDGTARIATAAPGAALLRLVHHGSVIHERTVQIGATPETRVQIRLATATLQGTVISAGRPRRDGGVVDLRARLSPAAGVPVYLERRTSDGLVTGGSWASDLPSMHSTTVDSSGRFVFEDLEPGSYEATYRSEGRPSKTVSLAVQPGPSRVTIEVPPGELSGRVLQADGRAAGFMTIRVLDAAGSELLVQSDQFGRFETIGVATGPAVVTAEADGSAASVRVDVDDAHPVVIEMVLRPKASGVNDERLSRKQ